MMSKTNVLESDLSWMALQVHLGWVLQEFCLLQMVEVRVTTNPLLTSGVFHGGSNLGCCDGANAHIRVGKVCADLKVDIITLNVPVHALALLTFLGWLLALRWSLQQSPFLILQSLLVPQSSPAMYRNMQSDSSKEISTFRGLFRATENNTENNGSRQGNFTNSDLFGTESTFQNNFGHFVVTMEKVSIIWELA